MNDYWSNYSRTLTRALAATEVGDRQAQILTVEAGLALLCDWTHSVQDARRTMHFIGNGASACMASHLSADWSKNAGVKAVTYNDAALLTALGNDLGYDQVFARPVERFGESGDLLVTISSSGNSPSILNAIDSARTRGLKVVTFSGMKPDNRSRHSGDLNFFVPAWTYGIVESSHHALLHAWLDRFLDIRDWEIMAR